MTSSEYRFEVEKRGSQKEVSKLLNIRPSTLSNRCTGSSPIKKEAELAILALPIPKLNIRL